MIIGVIRCELLIYDSQSLKQKRSVLKSILTRLKQNYNITVSEISYQDTWQRTELAIVSVASAKLPVERELQRVLQYIDSIPEIERTITKTEWL